MREGVLSEGGTGPDEGAPAPAAPAELPPRVADGVELIGEYEGSGYRVPPSIARRADGQVVQLTPLLYQVAAHADGRRSYAEIADAVAAAQQREVTADNVRYLIEEKLRPLGIMTLADGSSPQVAKVDPLLALRFKAEILPEHRAEAVTSAFRPLFLAPVVLAVVAGFVALDVWLFGIHGIGQSTRELIYNPPLLLAAFVLLFASAGFHEFGHAAACRFGGGKPGGMGAGIYIVYPAFYTDVTDAYRLNRAGRLRTDLGGLYFNMVFALVTAGVYLATRFEPILILVLIQHVQMLHQLMPVVRLDGYYILADLTGVPDLFGRIKPTLTSMLPWRQADERVQALKPWVRIVVTAWVLAIVPLLGYVLVVMAISAPRIVATAWDSLAVQLDDMRAAFGAGDVLSGLAGVVSVIALVLPLAGMTYTFGRIIHRLLRWGVRATAERPVARAGAGAVALAAVIGLTWVWWPTGEYRPIQPGERATAIGALQAVREVPSGRPALTPERQAELDGAPTERERRRAEAAGEPVEEEAPEVGETTTTTTTEPESTTTTTTEDGTDDATDGVTDESDDEGDSTSTSSTSSSSTSSSSSSSSSSTSSTSSSSSTSSTTSSSTTTTVPG